MHIQYLPTLAVQRELYERPRDMQRFRWYLEQMLGGTDDVQMPITAVNPMGREHCLQAVLALQAIDADGVAERAAREAAAELPDVGGAVRVFVNLLDDRMGGWTNRTFTEYANRYGDVERVRANRRRRFAGVWCWTSETYASDDIHTATRDALFRAAHWLIHGAPRTLREMLALDHAAFAFSGALVREIDAEEIAYTRAALESHLDATDQPTCLAALFGDAAARACGYPPLGVAE